MSTLLLMRHADYSDADVTPYGFGQCDSVAKQLREKGIIPQKAVSSAVKRAFQTAQRVVASVNPRVVPDTVKSLTPLTDDEEIGVEQAAQAKGTNVMDALDDARMQRVVDSVPFLSKLGKEHGVVLAVTHDEQALRIAKRFDTEVPSLDKAGCFVFDLPDDPSVGKPKLVMHLRP